MPNTNLTAYTSEIGDLIDLDDLQEMLQNIKNPEYLATTVLKTIFIQDRMDSLREKLLPFMVKGNDSNPQVTVQEYELPLKDNSTLKVTTIHNSVQQSGNFGLQFEKDGLRTKISVHPKEASIIVSYGKAEEINNRNKYEFAIISRDEVILR